MRDHMTVEQLNNLYWLNREIEEQKERLAELESLSPHKESVIAGLPKGKRITRPTEQFACEIVDLRAIIQANLEKILPERRRLERYISTINSPDIRIIFRLRHINGMTWEQIGNELGYTASGVWRKHHNYIKKLSKQSK